MLGWDGGGCGISLSVLFDSIFHSSRLKPFFHTLGQRGAGGWLRETQVYLWEQHTQTINSQKDAPWKLALAFAPNLRLQWGICVRFQRPILYCCTLFRYFWKYLNKFLNYLIWLILSFPFVYKTLYFCTIVLFCNYIFVICTFKVY